MLYGRTPFQDSGSFGELFSRIGSAKFTIPTSVNVSDVAANFVTELLEIDAEVRLTAVQALQHPWIMGSAGAGRKHRLLSGAEVFFRADNGSLEPMLPTDSGVGLEMLSLSDG